MKKTSLRKVLIFALALVILSSVIILIAYKSDKGNSPLGRVAGAILTPLEYAVSKIGDGVSYVFGYFYRYDTLVLENQQLKEEVARLRELESDYYAAISEYDELRKLSKISERHEDFICEPCAVISVDGSGFQSALTLNKGSINGIEVGDCVITLQNDTVEAIVGYVSEVGPNYCKVITILNLHSKIAARITRTRDVVVAEGDYELAASGYIKVPYLDNDADVKPGDFIETSGSGGTYPPGIIIGRVSEFTLERHGISSYAAIEPMVDVNALKNVFVVKDFDVSP